MATLNLVLLPGLDGSGLLFRPFIQTLPANLNPIVVSYPSDQALDYDDLLPLVLRAIPRGQPFAILGESFSGPLAVMAAALAPTGLKAVILCASFVQNPLPTGFGLIRPFVRGFCFRLAPEFVRTRALLGEYATPELRRLSADALATVSPGILAHRVRSLLRVDVRRELPACPVPIMYLQGAHDRVVGRRNLADVVNAYPATQIARLPAPHFVLQAQPTAAAKAVSTFLTAANPGGPVI